jgi:hypothetical protein
MVMELLSEQLDKTLRNIAVAGDVPMLKADIQTLINLSLITPKFGGGWMVNSKGRAYLKEHKTRF